ncbi:zinc finger, CCHC-type containing protein [Tanacetum coccineum]
MHFFLSSMSMVYVLTTPILEDGGDNTTVEQIKKNAKWDNDDYVCRGLILNGKSDPLFDIYQNVESFKELWDSLDAKYMAEDASTVLSINYTKYALSPPLLTTRLGTHTLDAIPSSRTLDLVAHGLSSTSISLPLIYPGLLSLNTFLGFSASTLYVSHSIREAHLPSSLAFMSTLKLNNSIICHARLGHVYFNRMQDMSKDGLILSFDMDTEKCKTCMLTKITKKPFQNVKCETEVLELIYNNLCDLHATHSLGNKKYFVIFIYDASRFCYVYLLHTKDEALDKFKVFKTEVELQQSSQIKRFRTDRGCQYMDTLYFQSVGIIHETTTPYTPQQDGITERKNRLLKEMVNSMLSYSRLSQGF